MVRDQPLTAIRTVLFDFDGTLFHLPVDAAAVRADLGLATGEKIGDALQRYIDEGNQAQLDVVTRHERESVATGEFTPGAVDALKRLRASHNVAIVTRNSRHAVTDALGDAADGLFIVGREDVARLKPDSEGIDKILAHFGAKPAESVLVGDTYHDVEAAHAAGMRSVVVRNSKLAYAPEGADAYLDTLDELVTN
ncbi:HAD family hydrolase [Kibdelosporangium phytohabitans]|uniref:Haloacid dehalogenase n=1 Tax=Kibdelosporangium phytohabitans TaxID=860235 RepID=A0A0N7F2F4_9PSEU|nr:HAD-IA family hydrolase [Kibdelosporangium phytohabitans]ALG05679.1 hypothetical protein AOZ06_00915 [Kibdelosporangium phytohabitans]MBE1466339.1 phosphoglycolate phosphatase [Kibdelosporangium phytohabitans]